MVVTPDTTDDSALGAIAADTSGQNTPMGIAAGAAGNPNAAYLIKRAKEEGVDPLDLATAMHYETKGTMDPGTWGGKGDNYFGAIQFGPEERKKYNIDTENPNWQNQVDGSLQFLKDRGFDPKKHGLLDMYSTINSGSPGNYDASDGNGTVASHVQNMMATHRDAASKWLASAGDSSWKPSNAALAYTDSPSSDASNTPIQQALTTGEVPTQTAAPTMQQKLGGLGNSLTGLGAALMARDNPNGAAALRAQMAPAATKTSLTDGGHVKVGNQWFQKNFNPATGQTSMTPVTPTADDLQTDQTNAITLATAKKKLDDLNKPDDPNDELLKAKPADQKLYQQNAEGMRTTANVVNDMQDFQKLVRDNDLSVNMLASGEAEVRNRLGAADPNSAALKDAQRLIHRIQYEYMKSEAGPATKQKIQQTKEIMFPAGAEYSSPTLLQAFGKAEQQMRDHYSALKDTNDSYNTGYKGLPKAITNSKGESMAPADFSKGVYSRWNSFDDKDRPAVNDYINKKLTGQAVGNPAAPSSLLEFHKQRTQQQQAPQSGGASGSW